MIIYLKHPEHGRKVAINELEANQDKENGWVEYEIESIENLRALHLKRNPGLTASNRYAAAQTRLIMPYTAGDQITRSELMACS